MTPLSEDEYFKLSQHEDSVINHRLTWLLASQPLLFLAYSNVIRTRVGKGEAMLDPEAYKHAAAVLPWVGGLLAFAVWLGVLGRGDRPGRYCEGRRASGKTAGVNWGSTILGLIPPLTVPLIFVVAWWRVAR